MMPAPQAKENSLNMFLCSIYPPSAQKIANSLCTSVLSVVKKALWPQSAKFAINTP